MNWIVLLQLAISLGKSLLTQIDPKLGPISQELYDDLDAALDSLQAVHDKAVTNDELESLRTKPLW